MSLKGFSLLEAMIGITLLTFSLMGVVAMMVYFGSQTSDKTLKGCLLDGATNALAQYSANALPVSTSFTCENINITIGMSHSTFPSSNDCNNVTATATAEGKSIQLQTKICNFQ
jgi:Tfp pilus assembly protein PilV